MDIFPVLTFLLMGFGLGILHAFDPDHIAAVGGLTAGGQNGQARHWAFSLHWSLGHGAALIAVAVSVIVVGGAVPAQLSAVAEKCVGLVLVIIGCMALLRIGLVWGQHKHSNQRSSKFAAPVVGLLHGTAGSAPLLALIPLAQLSQPLVGLLYVLLFSVGVLLAMTAFGMTVTLGFRKLNGTSTLWLNVLQITFALFSLFFGLYLIISSFH